MCKFPDDVSGAAVGPTFNGHKSVNLRSLKMGPTAAPETSENLPYRAKSPKPKIKPLHDYMLKTLYKQTGRQEIMDRSRYINRICNLPLNGGTNDL